MHLSLSKLKGHQRSLQFEAYLFAESWIVTRNHFVDIIVKGQSTKCTKVDNTIENSNLDECKNQCDATDGCTAFNYWTTTNACELRWCPRPVPSPTAYNKDITGYHRNEEDLRGKSILIFFKLTEQLITSSRLLESD